MSEENKSALYSPQLCVGLKVWVQIGSGTSLHAIGTYLHLHFENLELTSFCRISMTQLYFDGNRDNRKHDLFLVYYTGNRPLKDKNKRRS